MSATSRACRSRGLREFRERHDRRTNGQHHIPQQTAGRPVSEVRDELNKEVARHARYPREEVGRIGEDVTRMLYEETASVEFKLIHMHSTPVVPCHAVTAHFLYSH